MELIVRRLKSNNDATVGILEINCSTICGTVEDEYRAEKVMHETRIPSGVYDVTLRAEGGFHERYKDKYPKFHEGMLAISNAPDYKIITDSGTWQYILIHVGNTDDHTSGCLLVNYSLDFKHMKGMNSSAAYIDVYQQVLGAIKAGEKVTIAYIDEDLN